MKQGHFIVKDIG